jgi:hypothetical protein
MASLGGLGAGSGLLNELHDLHGLHALMVIMMELAESFGDLQHDSLSWHL